MKLTITPEMLMDDCDIKQYLVDCGFDLERQYYRWESPTSHDIVFFQESNYDSMYQIKGLGGYEYE